MENVYEGESAGAENDEHRAEGIQVNVNRPGRHLYILSLNANTAQVIPRKSLVCSDRQQVLGDAEQRYA